MTFYSLLPKRADPKNEGELEKQLSPLPKKTAMQNCWSLYLVDFQLRKEMEEFIPQLFNPRFDLFLLFVIWDDGQLWEIVPDQTYFDTEDYQLSFGGNNTRKVRRGQLPLLEKKEVLGSLNVLTFLLERKQGDSAMSQLTDWINQSDFSQRSKQKKGTALSSPIPREVKAFVAACQQEADKIGVFCIPLLGATLQESEFEKEKKMQLDEVAFSLCLELVLC